MKEFSKYIADKWNISEPLSKELCECYEKGYSPWYCADYRPNVAAELETPGVWSIYDFLRSMAELAPKKKRLLNALKKSGKLTDELEKQITLNTNSNELDDMLLPERVNPRSKGQLALKKGLGECADAILRQEEGAASLDDIVAPYVGKDPSLASADDVVANVKDIIAERFAYDETARTMVREFMYDDGFFEITMKSKTPEAERFAKFAGKSLPVKTLAKEDLLMFLAGEDKKLVRVKLTVQLFRITELLKHHFVVNPDSPGFSVISEAIDDSWLRLLQPIAERDVKQRLRTEAESWALSEMHVALEKQLSLEGDEKACIACGIADKKSFAVVACNDRGRLFGAALEKKIPLDRPVVSERLRQFVSRYRPEQIICADNESAPLAEAIIAKSIDGLTLNPKIVKVKHGEGRPDLAASAWMKKEFADLEEPMQKVLAAAIMHLQPLRLLPKIGPEYFSLHPLQPYVSSSRLAEYIERIISGRALSRGLESSLLAETLPALLLEPYVSEAAKKEITSCSLKSPFETKDDLLKVPGITESAFRCLAGYLLIPSAPFALDRTMVHPDHFSWLAEMCDHLQLPPDALVNDPEAVRSFPESDFAKKLFIEKKLIPQLQAGRRQAAAGAATRPRHKLKLTEIQEGSVVTGRVTNITPFGVFVNINAVCDGLIHISQVADTYVESADQVVSVGDTVSVRVLKVDIKKRRISLSMKGLGHQGPKAAPSKRQLSDLANHFQNR
ncbi:MAG TPA: Tex-like N-terminal domain-containing protein [Chitinivibrionales bacterium]|nr:Tex-like N-terminal domain-containing protein [Chitinivibrionales bacterium]